jgi:hypothetical protein
MTDSPFRDPYILNQLGGGNNGIFRKRDSNCNICGLTKKLTADHVPPKSVLESFHLSISQQFKTTIIGDKPRKPKKSNNGLRFVTICENCNNKILSQYDSRLSDFCKELGTCLKIRNSGLLEVPNPVQIECYPNAIIRAILGHFLSVKTDSVESVFDNKIRGCVRDKNASVPDDIYIYYNLYPYSNIKIFPEICAGNISKGGEDFVVYHIIKFFPIAFTVTDVPMISQWPNLNRYRDYPIDKKETLAIYLGIQMEEDFPERAFHAFVASPNFINVALVATKD